jgi:SAM-dependent methyltransferase
MSSFFRQQLEAYLGEIDVKAGAVLDIGGLQMPVKGRVRSWDVKSYKILDAIKSMKGETADYVADISRTLDYHESINEIEATFDAVFCLEVMEYVFDPLTALKNIAVFLKQKGVAYISFPFVYPMHPPEDTDYLRYTEHGVLRLLSEAGLKLTQTEIFVRRAGPGRMTLKRFYDEEGMKYRRDDLSYLDHIGYIVKVTKK